MEFTRLFASAAIWFAYDPKIKAELFSTALAADNQVSIFDPIDLSPEGRAQLDSFGRVAQIIVTNANHLRDTTAFARFYSAPIFAPAELSPELPQHHVLSDDAHVGPLQAIKIDGAAPGEFALYHSQDGGTLIVGDALINFDPHGFSLLPRKYCTDQKKMIRALQRLLELDFVRIFFAHGTPIMDRAHERLASLLES
jgi:glyoxylase-like metal-dependent hydrolase (beta-lactamase superfamily II)